MTRALVALCGALTLLCAGCGGGDGEVTPTETGWTAYPVTPVRLYFLRDGKVWPVAREITETDEVAAAALEQLLAGPTEQERADLGFTTAIPDSDESMEVSRLEIGGGLAKYNPPRELSRRGLAQFVYTLTQFPSIGKAEIDGKIYTRADFEDFTPAILVESPLAFAEVASPLRVTGTANTFEANFQYTLTDTDGLIVDENFVTATSGTGTRGTFEFTTKPYTVPFEGVGSLIVFESSAKDGSKINLVEIPLRMTR